MLRTYCDPSRYGHRGDSMLRLWHLKYYLLAKNLKLRVRYALMYKGHKRQQGRFHLCNLKLEDMNHAAKRQPSLFFASFIIRPREPNQRPSGCEAWGLSSVTSIIKSTCGIHPRLVTSPSQVTHTHHSGSVLPSEGHKWTWRKGARGWRIHMEKAPFGAQTQVNHINEHKLCTFSGEREEETMSRMMCDVC